MYSGQFCARTETRSPRPMPSAARALASRNARPANSPCVIVRPSKMTAGAAALSCRLRTVNSPRFIVSANASPRSFDLPSRVLHDLLPARDLLAQEGRELLRRAAERIDPHGGDLPRELRVLQGTADLAI